MEARLTFLLSPFSFLFSFLSLSSPCLRALSGGLPIGACVTVEKVAQSIGVGEHGSTFAGGPLVCAVAQSVFTRISNPKFLEEVREKGEYLKQQLLKLPGKIKEVWSPFVIFLQSFKIIRLVKVAQA